MTETKTGSGFGDGTMARVTSEDSRIWLRLIYLQDSPHRRAVAAAMFANSGMEQRKLAQQEQR